MKIAKQLAVLAVLCLAVWGGGGLVPQQWSASAQDGGPENPTPEGLVHEEEMPETIWDGPIESEAIIAPLAAPVGQTDTTQWPQLQNDPQRTGYTPANLGTNFSVVWKRAFQPEKVHPQVQAIIYGGRVFVGTESGNLYALNAANGAQNWVFKAGGPILNSVAAGDGRVYFGSMDGAVYAVNASTGAQLWKQQLSSRLGFSTAPLLSGGKLLIGGRNGVFYALNPSDGGVSWSFKAGGPILMTAAANTTGTTVYFTAMDMRVYARSISTGASVWTSGKVPAMAFKDYYPVVWGGYVYVRPWNKGDLGPDILSDPPNEAAQLAVLNAYNPNTMPITMFRFREDNGELGLPVIHYWYQTMNGASAPPCVDRDGFLVMSAPFPQDDFYIGWGRLNPNSRVLVDLLVENSSEGRGHGDETMATTCTANLIFAVHIQEQNVQFTGAFNLNNNTWTKINLGKSNAEMFNNTQGGGANAVSVANGLFYHISVYELIVRSAN